jgi:hypothetical protein
MPTYLVELYLADTNGHVVAMERVRAGTGDLVLDDIHVRCTRAIFVPEDETCFLLIEASTGHEVRMAMDRAGIRVTRVMEVSEVAAVQLPSHQTPDP